MNIIRKKNKEIEEGKRISPVLGIGRGRVYVHYSILANRASV